MVCPDDWATENGGLALPPIEGVPWARMQQIIPGGEVRHHGHFTHRDCRLQSFQRSAAHVSGAGVLINKSVPTCRLCVGVGC
jgi:hypothetical protein